MRLMRGKGDRAQRAAMDEDGALRLALDDGEERLPWLEGEDEEDDPPAVEPGRIMAFALAVLLALAVAAGALWWLWRGNAEPELVPDGSVIEAPEGPYKVRPADPGGREVEGTGAASFAIAEGRRIEGRIARQPAAPPTDGAEAGGPVVEGVGVQIGAYPTREAAQAGWRQLHTRLGPLSGRSHRILEGTTDSAPVYRLQVVAESLPAAQQLCRELLQAGGDCQVKR